VPCGSYGSPLDRPYTFIVLALLILIMSPVAILRTPTDIFRTSNIPVIAVAWQFTGLNPEEMEGRITTVRAGPDDDGGQYRAHRIDDGDGQSIVKFPAAECGPRYRQPQVTAIAQTALAAPPACSPPHHQLQRLDGADACSSPSPDVGAELTMSA